MNVIGCLIWFDESPTWLSTTVASLSRCCDHIVAVDGAYWLYPQAKPNSGPDQAQEIVSTAEALGMGATLHVPTTPWMGNEVEKRNFMLSLGLLVAEPLEDWLLVVDADEVVMDVPSNFRDVLASTEHDVATYQLLERMDWHLTPERERAAQQVAMPPGVTSIRGLLRALPTLHINQAHYSYAVERDGKSVFLWERDAGQLVDAVDTDLKIEHRRAFRDKQRLDSAEDYYRIRDELGVEKPQAIA